MKVNVDIRSLQDVGDIISAIKTVQAYKIGPRPKNRRELLEFFGQNDAEFYEFCKSARILARALENIGKTPMPQPQPKPTAQRK